MNRLPLALGVGLSIATAAVLLSTTASAQEPHPTEHGETKKAGTPHTLKTVIVTAQRRSQNLQDVPITVTALSSAEINTLGINNVGDLSGLAPSLVVAASPSGSVTPRIAIRGSTNVDTSLDLQSPVALYVDGVYYGKADGAIFDLVDLERIEVLNGPQGTLYGRNAFAGAINLITHKPSGVFNGRAEVDLGNYNDRVGKVAMDLPAIGKLNVSVGGRIDRRDGWFNTTPGSSVSQMGNRHSQSEFVDLLFKPTGRLSFNYRMDTHRSDQYPPYGQVLRSDLEADFGIPGIEPHAGRQTSGGVDAPVFQNMTMTGHSFTAVWDVNDHNTIKYIYGHRNMKYGRGLDMDGTALDVIQVEENPNDYTLSSNELQWIGHAGAWNWIVGLYHFDDAGFTNVLQNFFFHTVNIHDQYGFGTKSKAAYAQVDYHLTPRVTVTIGARRTIEHDNGFVTDTGPGIDVPAGTGGRTSSSATTPAASVSFKISPDVMVYGRYAVGFQAGGFNGEASTVEDATTPFKPEKKRSFEAGVKTMLLNRRLRLDGDIFYERNSNLQESVFTTQGSAAETIVNVGKSHDEGVEISADGLISDWLRVRANYSYLNERYNTFMVLGENVADNRAVVFAPKNTLNLIGDATLGRMYGGVVHALLTYRVSDGYYQYPYQIADVDPASQVAENTRIPGGGTLDARLSLGGLNWGSGLDGEVAVWVRNVTNADRVTGSVDFGPGFGNLIVGYPMDPRTFGVSLIASW